MTFLILMMKKKKTRFGIESLSSFCDKYEPALTNTYTDLFSSKEIQKLVEDFTGVEVPIPTIYELMIQMKYSYQLDEGNFLWLVKKEH